MRERAHEIGGHVEVSQSCAGHHGHGPTRRCDGEQARDPRPRGRRPPALPDRSDRSARHDRRRRRRRGGRRRRRGGRPHPGAAAGRGADGPEPPAHARPRGHPPDRRGGAGVRGAGRSRWSPTTPAWWPRSGSGPGDTCSRRPGRTRCSRRSAPSPPAGRSSGPASRPGCSTAGARRGPHRPRESEVLALLARGRSNAEIARPSTLSLKTVQNHVSNVLAKLQVRDRHAGGAAGSRAGADRHAFRTGV